MLAIVLLPEFVEKDLFESIIEEYAHKFKIKLDARIGVDHVGDYKCLDDAEYFEDEVQMREGKYYNSDNMEIPSYNVFERPKQEIVALAKSFALVDIERFARCAIGIPFTVLEVA